MNIGRFQEPESGYGVSIETLALKLNPVRFVKRTKDADFAVHGPDDGELGAAWCKTGEDGDPVRPARFGPFSRRVDRRNVANFFMLVAASTVRTL